MMRRFGVEIECIAPASATGNALGHAAGLLNGIGVTARVERYTGQNYTLWQCKPDISLRPQDRAAEVVSRTLPANPDSYDEVIRVATRLDSDGFVVNRTCGLHVHVNVADLPVRTRQLIVLRYAELQAEHNLMLPPSRRESNNYCEHLADRPGLEAAINTGSDQWRRGHGRHSEVVNTKFMYDSDARLEFRQAAGSIDGAKIVAWVQYLQEMVQEVATRAESAVFPARSARFEPPFRPAPRPMLPTAPRMHVGSDNFRASQQLANTGTVATGWALDNNIEARVLRRIIVGLRRHGVGIRTVSGARGPEYHLTSATAPCTVDSLFRPVVPVVAAPAPIAPAPAPVVATITAAEFVRYDFFSGLSAQTAAWVRSRRDTFSADNAA